MRAIRKVAFDVDGVLADLLRQYAAFYNRAHPDDLITPDMILTYDIRSALKYKEPMWEVPGFSTMPLMKEAAQVLPRIYRNMETIIVTAIPENSIADRLFWFSKLFPDFDVNKIFFESEKGKLANEFDVIFEDCFDNIRDIGPQKCVIYSQPYNLSRELDSAVWGRVANWNAIYGWLRVNARMI